MEILSREIADECRQIAKQDGTSVRNVVRGLMKQALAARDRGSLFVRLDPEMLASLAGIAVGRNKTVEDIVRQAAKGIVRQAERKAREAAQCPDGSKIQFLNRAAPI